MRSLVYSLLMMKQTVALFALFLTQIIESPVLILAETSLNLIESCQY